MSAPAVAAGRPTLRIRGTAYPVLLPTFRDPRLHLAGVIITLQVLGQVAFDFQLSIAQILVSLGVAAVLEVGLTFWRQQVVMWPASALLTGNGVAFVLRVPGTEHGDWWSMNGWWIFAGTSAVALLSKYVIRIRGRHVFNPSNFGLVLCFLLLGAERADPLALWWGPLSPALVFALVLIVAGGFLILRRLHLVGIAVGFWIAFAAGIGVLAASGHSMTAPWHVGPIEGAEFWKLLVTSPEILVFLFFMITDPKTIPASGAGRRVYAVGVGLLATVLIAPQTTEFATKVAILAALALVCAAHGVILLVGSDRLTRLAPRSPRRAVIATIALAGALVYGGLVVAAGVPARPEAGSRAALEGVQALPTIEVVHSKGIADIDEQAAQTIARDVVVDLRAEFEALRRRDEDLAATAASGEWLATLWSRMRTTSGPITVASYDVDGMRVRLRPSDGQGPPLVIAVLEGTQTTSTFTGAGQTTVGSAAPRPFTRTLELALQEGTYRIVRSKGGAPIGVAPGGAQPVPGGALGGATFRDVAPEVGLDFRQGAFRFGMSTDTTAMMGGGLCWLDYDGDGWLDLFVVNSHADVDIVPSEAKGGLPRSALYHNVGGRFEDVSATRRRRPAASRERLRGGRLQHGRSHRSLRDQRRVQRLDGLLGRAALEQRGRDVHRRRRPSRHQREGVALGSRRRGRERRRSTGSLRLVVYGPERHRRPGIGLPVRPRARPRSPLSQRGHRRERSLDFPRGRPSRGYREEGSRSRPRRGVHRRGRGRTPRPVRRERRRPEPALPQHAERQRARLRLRRTSPSGSRSTTRTLGWALLPATTTATVDSTSSSRTLATSSMPPTGARGAPARRTWTPAPTSLP